MAIIIYGGSLEEVQRQKECKHDWHGPCIDDISRYNKCKICFCVERDMRAKQYIEENQRDGEEIAIQNIVKTKEDSKNYTDENGLKWCSCGDKPIVSNYQAGLYVVHFIECKGCGVALKLYAMPNTIDNGEKRLKNAWNAMWG